MEALILSIVLLLLLILFVSEALPPEISALAMVFLLVVLTSSGIGNFLSPDEAVAGLANPAVITIAAMLIISEAQVRTGVVGFIGDKISSASRGKPILVMGYSLLAVAVFSSFINNTPVVALYIPLMLRICYRYNLNPSKYMIPVSYASILGGTSTLIGTSTNIIIAGVAADLAAKHPSYGIERITMFTVTPVGIVIAIAGLAVLLLFGRRLLPERKTVTESLSDMQRKVYLTELEIAPDSKAVNRLVSDVFTENYPEVEVEKVIRGTAFISESLEDCELKPGDIVRIRATANQIARIQRKEKVIITPGLGHENNTVTLFDSELAEMVIMPGSDYIGSTIEEVHFRSEYGVNVIALLSKENKSLEKEKIDNAELEIGDTLLIQGEQDAIARIYQDHNLLLLEGVAERVKNTRKAPVAVGVLISVVSLAAFGVLPIMVLSAIGALVLIMTGTVSIDRAYKSIDLNILILIAATVSLGTALEKTGTAKVYGDFLVSMVAFMGPVAMVGALFFITALLTTFMTNNAVAVPMTHIAVATASGFGYQAMPFIMAVLFGASACYASPVGYQTNLFAYGPGGYKFSDYFRLGVPLNLLTMVLAMILIPVFWPFQQL